MKRYWFCAIFAFLLLCGIGYFEIFGLPGNYPANLLRYALLGVSVVFIALVFLLGIRRGVRAHEGRNLFCAVCAALLGAGIVVRSIYTIHSLFTRRTTDAFGTLFSNRPALGLIEPVLGLLAAFVFFAIAGSELFGSSVFEKAPVLSAIPTIWFCLGVILHFVSKIAAANTAENSVEVLAVVFALLFLFEQAKTFARLDSAIAVKRMMQNGVIALVFLLASALQYGAELYFTGETRSSFETPTHVFHVLLALYILSSVVVLRRGEKEEKNAGKQPAGAKGEAA